MLHDVLNIFIQMAVQLYMSLNTLLANFKNKNSEETNPINTSSLQCVWFHAPDLGELRAALALLNHIQVNRPDLVPRSLHITVSNCAIIPDPLPTSLQPSIPFTLSHLPIATSKTVYSFLSNIRYAIFFEQVPNPLLFQYIASQMNIPIALLDARPPSCIHTLPPWNVGIRGVTVVTAQSPFAQRRIRRSGIQAPVMPSLKFLRRQTNNPVVSSTNTEDIPSRKIWLAASTHPADEKIVLDAHSTLLRRHPDLLLVLVPRDISRTENISKKAMKKNMIVTRRSESHSTASPVSTDTSTNVHIVDTMGELPAIYNLVNVALLGNTFAFSADGHNFAEAAHGSACVIRGPRFRTFQPLEEAVLRTMDAIDSTPGDKNSGCIWKAPIVCVRSSKEVVKYVQATLDNESEVKELGDTFKRAVLQLEISASEAAIDVVHQVSRKADKVFHQSKTEESQGC